MEDPVVDCEGNSYERTRFYTAYDMFKWLNKTKGTFIHICRDCDQSPRVMASRHLRIEAFDSMAYDRL